MGAPALDFIEPGSPGLRAVISQARLRPGRRGLLPLLLVCQPSFPQSALERLGIAGILDYVLDGAEPPDFAVRIVHHDVRSGRLPLLRRG